jgi:hypothetical protein
MEDPAMDYYLEIDFDVFTIVELRSVLKMLYSTSSYCFDDIYFLGENVIKRMDQQSVRLRNIENKGLVELVHETFNMLKRIHGSNVRPLLSKQILYDMHDKFNHYMYSELEDSPVASPVKSPIKMAPPVLVDPTGEVETESIPKKMKKVFRRK